jgi:hypothetical protein
MKQVGMKVSLCKLKMLSVTPVGMEQLISLTAQKYLYLSTDEKLNDTGMILNDTGMILNDTGMILNDTGMILNDTGMILNDTGMILNDTE